MSTTETALTAHLVVKTPAPDFLQSVAGELHDRFGIEHPTLQIESRPCEQVPCEADSDAPNCPP